jgi:hypothetical protein
MNAPRLAFSLAFDSAARIAPLGPSFDVALCDLVPPLLLGGSPNLFLRALLTYEQNVHVVAALNERGKAIAVRRRKQVWIAGRRALGDFASPLATLDILRSRCTLSSLAQDLSATLLVALHLRT